MWRLRGLTQENENRAKVWKMKTGSKSKSVEVATANAEKAKQEEQKHCQSQRARVPAKERARVPAKNSKGFAQVIAPNSDLHVLYKYHRVPHHIIDFWIQSKFKNQSSKYFIFLAKKSSSPEVNCYVCIRSPFQRYVLCSFFEYLNEG